MPASNFINATDARRDFFDLLEGLKKSPYPVTITHKGQPQAVIMSQEDYSAWLATMETLADQELMEKIRQSDRAFAKGEYVTWGQMKKELEEEGFLDKKAEVRDNKSDVSVSSRARRQKRSKKNR